MTNLVAAYQANDILAFERILRTNRRARALHHMHMLHACAVWEAHVTSSPSGHPGGEPPLPTAHRAARSASPMLASSHSSSRLFSLVPRFERAGGAQEDHLRRPLHTQLHRRPAKKHPHAGAAGPPRAAPPAACLQAQHAGGCTPLRPWGTETSQAFSCSSCVLVVLDRLQ